MLTKKKRKEMQIQLSEICSIFLLSHPYIKVINIYFFNFQKKKFIGNPISPVSNCKALFLFFPQSHTN